VYFFIVVLIFLGLEINGSTVLNYLGLEDTDFKAVLNGDFFDLYGRSQIHFLHLIHFCLLMFFVISLF